MDDITWGPALCSQTYLFLTNCPRKSPRVTEAHAAEDRHRDAKATLSKLAVFAF